MKGICITDNCGDWWNLTVGKEYDILDEKEYLLYISNGKNVTQSRVLIVDDIGEEYWYPKTCFEIRDEV